MYETKALYVRSGGRWVATSGGGGDPSIQYHDGNLPQPADPLPSGIESAFRAYADGLHYFKGSGSLVSILRQPLQTTIVVDGQVRSVARVVKSPSGQPTPQNPSTLVICDATGKWSKMTSESLNTPFGPPEDIDLFELPVQINQFVTDAIAAIPPLDPDEVVAAIDGRSISPLAVLLGGPIVFGGEHSLFVATTANGPRPTITWNNGNSFITCAATEDVYTKTESDRRFLDQQWFLDNAYYGPGISFQDTNSLIRWRTPNLNNGTGPDARLGLSLWASSPSSPAIPRLYFESNDDDGGYLAYLEELDAYLKTGSAAEDIKGKGIEPLVVRVGDGGIVYQDSYKLYVDNVGIGPRAVIEYSNLGSVTRLICMAQGDAYTKAEVDAAISALSAPDLTTYAKLNDTAQAITAKTVTAEAVQAAGVQFLSQSAPSTALMRADVGGQERLVYAAGSKTFPVAFTTELDQYAKLWNFNQQIGTYSIKLAHIEFANQAVFGFDSMGDGGPKRLVIADLETETTDYVAYKSELNAYAKKEDPSQTITAQGVLAQAFAFNLTTGLRFIDTGEGYGTRLVFAYQKDGQEKVELIPYKSDIEEALSSLNPRIEALESRVAAPAVPDLSGYAKTDWVTAWLEANAPSKSSVYTKPECDSTYATQADVYTRAQADALFALKGNSPAQVIQGVDINDPALADFKKGILDAVALMMAGGGKQPPEDIDWTRCLNAAGTGPSGAVEVRMIAGVLEFRGTQAISSSAASQNIFQLPASFPLPDMSASYPIAARLAGSNAVYAYATVSSTSRTIGVTPAGTINEVTFSGLRFRAAY